jgi:hypothetical protein
MLPKVQDSENNEYFLGSRAQRIIISVLAQGPNNNKYCHRSEPGAMNTDQA